MYYNDHYLLLHTFFACFNVLLYKNRVYGRHVFTNTTIDGILWFILATIIDDRVETS